MKNSEDLLSKKMPNITVPIVVLTYKDLTTFHIIEIHMNYFGTNCTVFYTGSNFTFLVNNCFFQTYCKNALQTEKQHVLSNKPLSYKKCKQEVHYIVHISFKARFSHFCFQENHYTSQITFFQTELHPNSACGRNGPL